MIKKLISRVFSGKLFKSRAKSGAQVMAFKDHGVARESISACALSVTDTLQAKGYAAFVVGGAVRDLLLKRAPKDFDVATSATPEEVRGLFRRSRIIGRRFQIVHVMCGRETVEVSTFRAGHDTIDDNSGAEKGKTDEHGRILRDNVFGNQQQDATRRDLSINALFYDPTTQQVHDYHGGVKDLRERRLRMIGDATQRYREDPVRMLRAVRFAAALDFEIDTATRKPISELADLLQNVPPARLFDEMLKLLLSGHAVETVKRLRKDGLHHGLLPPFPGFRPYEDAFQHHMLCFGATVHFIVPELDAGNQIVFQSAFSVLPGTPLADIKRVGESDHEPNCIVEGIRRVVDREVELHFHRVVRKST